MENHTPLKRHRAIISFSKDHHFGLLLVWKIKEGIKKSVSPERISKYVLFFFKEDLEKHFKEEEQLLFIKLPVNDILRKQAEADHYIIYKLIDEIGKNMNDIPLLDQLADTLEKHIRFEERELFNHLQNNIHAEDLEIIATRLANNSNEIDEKWEDVFWEIKKQENEYSG
ncbi:MAG: hemerythrin domain-containing protein [Bacteroidota bacterium]|nr:hemerythrin domain-containing protein [Bacteroidota bacterium]